MRLLHDEIHKIHLRHRTRAIGVCVAVINCNLTVNWRFQAKNDSQNREIKLVHDPFDIAIW